MKLFIFCFAICSFGVESTILPERLQKSVCKKSDRNYQACFRQSMDTVKPYFLKGIPELGYSGFEPLLTKSLKVEKPMGFGTSINANMQNISVTGFTNAIVDDLRVDPNNLYGEIRFTLPSTILATDLEVTGSIVFVPINIIGNFQGAFSPVRVQMNFQLSKYEKNGQWYFNMDKVNTWLDIGAGRVYIKAKNPNDQGGADFISNFYNSNQGMVTGAIYPLLQDLVGQIIKNKLAEYMAKVPGPELLPE